jgi:protein arginine N-methyltransferase 1
MSHLDLLQFHAFCLTRTGSRLTQYANAIASVVRNGDVLVDLGTGSGLLAVLAVRAGARRVYAIESSDAVHLGRLLVKSAGCADRIDFIQSDSARYVVHETADVLVADIHDTFGLQAGGLASFVDARRRLLKPGGIVIPQRIELMIAPVEAPEFYEREIDVWAGVVHGVDLSSIRAFAVGHVHSGRFEREQLLCAPAVIGSIDLARSTSLYVTGSAVVRIQRDGLVHGLCGCFVTTLADGIRMGNVPGESATTNFAQAFFPFDRVVPVVSGDEVAITIESRDGHAVRWRAEISGPDQSPRARFEHSTFDGLLVPPRGFGPSHPEPLSSVLPSIPVTEPATARLRVHPSVLSRELAGETVLLNLESGVYYGLDAVGTRAWNLLAEERTLTDVCSIMLEEFDVSPERLKGDLATLVKELCEKQLLVPAESLQ